MPSTSNARYQLPPALIQQAVWLYLRFTLSYRDVPERRGATG
jgi:putative transposase